jgi:hypothetical protein
MASADNPWGGILKYFSLVLACYETAKILSGVIRVRWQQISVAIVLELTSTPPDRNHSLQGTRRKRRCHFLSDIYS